MTSITKLYYRTFGDMDRAFAEIAAAGYEGVELFDGNFLEYSAAEMRKLLADNGLSLVAAYAGANFIFDDVLPEELQRIVQSADRLAELGGEHLVVGGGAKRYNGTVDTDYYRLGAALDRVNDIGKSRGRPLSSAPFDHCRRAGRRQPDLQADFNQLLPRYRAPGCGWRRAI